jgi:hypothetical protein
MAKNIKLVLLLAGIIFVSCKSSYISIQVLKPAQITVPAEIKTIAFINRSLPAKRERVRNVIEGAMTGENLFADRIGSEECIKGVFNGLQDSPRFTGVIYGGGDIRGTGTRQFPELLDWAIVDDICKANNTDALVCLEVFDSDSRRVMTDRKVTRKQDNRDITYIEYTATLYLDIESGWRIYYPARRKVIDQNIYTDTKYWSSTSDAGRKAEQGLPPMERALSEAGSYVGNQYAIRISPRWIRVSRDYYRKGNDDFERAKRMAEINDWKGAAELWQKYTNNPDVKIAGYATYNMALACEMEGDLEAAISWTKKSYIDYKNKHAGYYMNVLQRRLNEQQRLDEQMKGTE